MFTRKYFITAILGAITLMVIVLLISFSKFLSSQFIRSKKSTKEIETPYFAIVFPQDRVNRIDLIVKPSDWAKILSDLKSNFGDPNDSLRQHGFMPPPMDGPDTCRFSNQDRLPMPLDSTRGVGGPPPMLNGGNDSGRFHPHHPNGGMPPVNDQTPIYIPCTIQFEGVKWEGVGFRFKGNSSLMMSWMRGIKKLPFRLDFNKYKDSLPETQYQNFYGFSKLSFSSNNNDKTLIREKITSDILIESGVKAAHTAYYRVYIDYGEGPVYFGLYTVVEIVEDTMLKTQFDDGSGNCYKPDGPSASFVGSFEKKSFVKKNNKKSSDWSDVEKFYKILNSPERLSNPMQWCNDIESVFDVHNFIKWLAINTTIQNWDSYGSVPHNYYLYHSATSGKLVWIPWDHNEAMEGKGRELSISLSNVSEDWPLIKFLMEQPEYQKIYKEAMKSFIVNIFNTKSMNNRIDRYKTMITPFVIGENGEQRGYTFLDLPNEFYNSIDQIKKHVERRNKIAIKYLGL